MSSGRERSEENKGPVQWQAEPREGYTAVGRVVRAHGLRGEVRVHAFAAGAPNLQRGRRIEVGGVRMTVLAARPDREAWLIALDGFRDRAGAEGVRGLLLEVADSEVARADSDSYFVHELVGLRVVTAEGRLLGRLVEVLQPGGNDVYVVRGEGDEEILVPATGEVVSKIDLAGGEMVVTPMAGLLDDSQ